MFPEDLKYLETHEWARREDDIVVVGITDYAQEEIQDVVFVELPEVGMTIKQGQAFGVIESVKAAFDLNAPVSGEIVEINTELEDAPELVNEDPYDSGWMIHIRMSSPKELDDLLSPDEYQTIIEAEEEE